MTLPFRLRPGREDDLGFIITTWLNGAGEAWSGQYDQDGVLKKRGLRHTPASAWARVDVPIGYFADLTRKFTRNAVANILQRETCRVVVACDVENDDVAYGYAVAEPAKRIVHWVATKYRFEGQGLARAMLTSLLPDAARGVTLTYLPLGFLKIQSRWPVRFDPHAK